MMSTKTKNMERRNIQISGGSTYVISLPKKWIEKLKLKNGDSMQIVNNPNNSITLSADARQEESTTNPEIKMAGIPTRKESLAAVFLSIPENKAEVNVIPDLETPGNTERD